LRMEISDLARVDADKALDLCKETLTLSQDVKVEDKEGYENAALMLSEIRIQKEMVEAHRESFVRPLADYIKNLNLLFKPSLDFLKSAEEVLKRGLLGFRAFCKEQEKESLVVAQKAAQDGDSDLFNDQMALVSSFQIPKIKNISFRDKWEFEVEDINKIPLEFLKVDEVKLKRLISEKKSNVEIPGVRVFFRESTIIRKG